VFFVDEFSAFSTRRLDANGGDPSSEEGEGLRRRTSRSSLRCFSRRRSF